MFLAGRGGITEGRVGGRTAVAELMQRLALLLIRGYQRLISPMLPPSCRFLPTCSEYSYEAVARYGIWRGGWLALRRIARCHPFHPGGYDPVR